MTGRLQEIKRVSNRNMNLNENQITIINILYLLVIFHFIDYMNSPTLPYKTNLKAYKKAYYI